MNDPNRKECSYSEKPNNSDTISRQEAIDAMDTWDKFGCNPDGRLVRFDDNKHYVPYVRYDDMVYVIKSLPPAQPEIIRCKDCRYYKTYQYVNGIRKFLPKCSFNDIYVAEEDFCSHAERCKK